MPDFVVEQRPDGPTLVVTGAWSEAAADAIRRGQAERLWLNHARGFSEPSLDFLSDLPVRSLLILDRRLRDLTPVARLGDTLEELRVQSSGRSRVPLAALPRLRVLSAHWQQVRDSIAAHGARLESAYLGGFVGPDLRPLASLTALESLELPNTRRVVTLDGADALSSLTSLRVAYAAGLVDITHIRARAPTLRVFELQNCPHVDQLGGVEALQSVVHFGINACGDIESLAPLRFLKNLELFHAWGSTRVVDGDLSALAALPRLRELRMVDRRGYRPTVEEISRRFAS